MPDKIRTTDVVRQADPSDVDLHPRMTEPGEGLDQVDVLGLREEVDE